MPIKFHSCQFFTRGRVNVQKKATPLSGGSKSFKKASSKPAKNQKQEINQVANLQSIVQPEFPNPAPLSLEEQKKDKYIMELYGTQLKEQILEKRAELDRMYNKMKEACLELEKTDARLFMLAMRKPMGEYFPVERKFLVDTPPHIGWNEKHALTTMAK